MRKRLIKFTSKDFNNVLTSTELVISMVRILKNRYEKQNIFIDESLLLDLVKDNLYFYLVNKKKLKLQRKNPR